MAMKWFQVVERNQRKNRNYSDHNNGIRRRRRCQAMAIANSFSAVVPSNWDKIESDVNNITSDD